jgi:glyoxylase-like metal-dependent hydrolase (beta-lactamase superfamily II)
MKIIPLSEGSFTIDATKVFVPFDQSKDDLQQRPKGSLLVEVQPFVLVSEKDTILLDTGLGFSDPDGVLQIHRNLVNNDVDPLSVTKVLLSHLHKDHAGGVERMDTALQQNILAFPNATYYVNRDELNFALEKGKSSYLPEELKLLKSSDKVVMLDNLGVIDDYISYEVTAAHSPYHQVFWIKDEEQTIFFGADDAPQLQQMKSRFVAKYDFDGKKSMELRMKWWEQGADEHWTFLFYHDIKSPVISL